jgi:hypothetical protein
MHEQFAPRVEFGDEAPVGIDHLGDTAAAAALVLRFPIALRLASVIALTLVRTIPLPLVRMIPRGQLGLSGLGYPPHSQRVGRIIAGQHQDGISHVLTSLEWSSVALGYDDDTALSVSRHDCEVYAEAVAERAELDAPLPTFPFRHCLAVSGVERPAPATSRGRNGSLTG